MGKIVVEVESAIGAPPELTYRLIADDNHHRQFLPEAITNFKTLEGGLGRGTVHSFTLTAGKRVRDYVMRVDEPEPGVITESDEGSSLVTSFTVIQEGSTCRVRIRTEWDGAGGVGGFGRLANDPSPLPSDHYGLRLALALAVVWAGAAVIAVVRLRRNSKAPR